MGKILLDKYYTPSKVAKHCVNKVDQIIGINNISEFIEPSAGAGSFLPYLRDNYQAFDIDPDNMYFDLLGLKEIQKTDFLKLKLDYLKHRCVIGNPPFGLGNTLSVKFYKKAIEIGDYIAFILPISQYNNNQQMFHFDLIYSEALPEIEYSGVPLKCCFNIYRRPKNGLNIKPINYTLKDVTVLEWRRKGIYKHPDKYDFAMCSWGVVGTPIKYKGQFAQECYVIVNNLKFKSEIIELLNSTNWKTLMPYISTPRLKTWQIYKYLKDSIPELS